MVPRLSNGRFASQGKGRVHRPNKSKAEKKLLTHFAICLDSSGSMLGIKQAAINAFNKNVEAVRDGAKRENQSARVSLITFGEAYERGKVYERFFNADPDTLKLLDVTSYRPVGWTPLLDAVGLAIERLESFPSNSETSYVVVVITDGYENDSVKYTTSSLKEAMQRVTATDHWTFAFLVPPGSKKDLCQMYGVPEGNVQEWEATSKGMYESSIQTNSAIESYYVARSTGATKTMGFFTTDASKLTTAKVKKALDDIRSKVAVWTVPSEMDIRTFVESHGRPYKLGKAYYQLSKPETVQHHKDILLIEKGTSAVYAGDDARTLLGLQDFDVKVVPGNHANWDIFVQSTSTNRKLVRGTRLVCML